MKTMLMFNFRVVIKGTFKEKFIFNLLNAQFRKFQFMQLRKSFE